MSTHTLKPYTALTPIGQVRRIYPLALAALQQYDIPVRSLRVHSFATNLMYRVQTVAGERLMLRMAYPGWRTLEDLLAEAAWLEALDSDTDIGAPRVIRSRSGDYVIPMSCPGTPGPWYASLMTWVDGRLLAHALTCANLERMGALFARLHIHGKAWTPPAGFTTKRFEAFLSRGEPDVLFGGADLGALSVDVRQAFLRAREWVEHEYRALDRRDLRVIHCDLWHENVRVDRGRLRPFDFEDTIWGYRLHDIAMGMLDLLETVGNERYAVLLAAFRAGYESLLDWPSGNLAVLQIGRMLWQANWVARFARPSLDAVSTNHARIFRGFESTGVLRFPDRPAA